MVTRPESHSEKHSARFQDWSLVKRYHLRPTYPAEIFDILASLIADQPRSILDIGCGTGDVTRPLATFADSIDAVDVSLPMLEHARILPGGNSPAIRWIHGRAEDLAARPSPYALITAGQSLHWMDWDVVLPRLASLLSPRGVLAIVTVRIEPRVPWQDGHSALVRRFTNNPTYVPVDMIPELEKAGLFLTLGSRVTAPVPMQQSVDDYIAGQHAQSNLSLDTMGADEAAVFAQEMRDLLEPFAKDDVLSFSVVGHLIWGKPLYGGNDGTGK